MRFASALLLLPLLLLVGASVPCKSFADLADTVRVMASYGDRTLGSPGSRQAAEFIFSEFTSLGFETVGRQKFQTPVRRYRDCLLTVGSAPSIPLSPFVFNAISPEITPPEGLTGPLVYVGEGSLSEMAGLDIDGSIVVMDLDSARNWENAAMLGAKALIYISDGPKLRGVFLEKKELTPVDFPIFILDEPSVSLLNLSGPSLPRQLESQATVKARGGWTNAAGENVYCVIPGSDPDLSDELLIIEAFYDSSAFVFGRSPGAEEAASIATLLEIARDLKKTPPKRSVLLLASGGKFEAQAGMREFIWTLKARGRHLKEIERNERRRLNRANAVLEALSTNFIFRALTDAADGFLWNALETQIKDDVDRITTRLNRLRLEGAEAQAGEVERLAEKRRTLLQFLWRQATPDLSPHGKPPKLLLDMLPKIRETQEVIKSDASRQLEVIQSSRKLRALTSRYEISIVASLHLSSHGEGVGAFDYGFQYDIRPDRNRTPRYSLLSRFLQKSAAEIEARNNLPQTYIDTLRPSRIRPWQSRFIDSPQLGGEISALGGLLGFTFATASDARPLWGTPYDVPEKVDFDFLERQKTLVLGLLRTLANTSEQVVQEFPRDGLAELEGSANFIRQGELFPDQAAPGTVVQAYQGPAIYYAMSDSAGRFHLKGICDKKNTYHKVILEGYKFAPDSGQAVWAIDKKQTGKSAYRVKMNRQVMQTKLVMFAARQITLFNLVEPRTFNYMPRITILDGRREAPPQRFWYSRIDTRQSTLASVYLEPGTPLKLTLSDSLLSKKLVLTNWQQSKPEGKGYLPAEWPALYSTEYRIATDMWGLLGPRIKNLEQHGIVNQRIQDLQAQGTGDLKKAAKALENRQYDDFMQYSRAAWATANRVYNDVENTQKDVLIGVLFYIALFVPFAYCLERLTFAFADIHKRIAAFLAILCSVIAIVYWVHPAFQLTYSPLVVVLAFFIVGLSAMVSLIIIFRFEKEMESLQKRSGHVRDSGISKWKAFTAALVIGIPNLRRRKIRTSLTCVTLIILTFTIMSFTSVKSTRKTDAVLFNADSPYQGIMIKTLGWNDIPPQALSMIRDEYSDTALIAPRVWLETSDRTRATIVPLSFGKKSVTAEGVLGLSASEPQLSRMDTILTGGRWFRPSEKNAVLLPSRLAVELGIDPGNPGGKSIFIFGVPLQVAGCFDEKLFAETMDLDGEIYTPAIYPSEAVLKMGETELEALESGEDVRTFQSRYHHVDAGQTLIMPYRTLMALGGKLKAVAIRPYEGISIKGMAEQMVDRFGLTLFAGTKEGTFVYHASDVINYSGVPNIMVPILIAVLIVLNTMISSVYERKREIGVYTSVGMAPTHVSYLFIAEALAFATISVVFGYVLAQTAANFLSSTPLWSGMTANYSSLAGIGAMILVMTVTLVSVLYPSKVAADIAIPDVNRAWTMPEAEKDEIAVTLPFLMKYPEQECLGGFLLEYYRTHQEVSHGLFCSDEIACAFACPTIPGRPPIPQLRAEAEEPPCLTIRGRVWLAPFDFGVKQITEIIFCPSSFNPNFLEIRMNIIREAGEAAIWKRLNKSFLNDIRKQLLIWRSLSAEVHGSYEGVVRKAMEAQANSRATTGTRGS